MWLFLGISAMIFTGFNLLLTTDKNGGKYAIIRN